MDFIESGLNGGITTMISAGEVLLAREVLPRVAGA
jgi:hypothetical protein